MTANFARELRALLETRGAAAELSRSSGVPTSHISRMASGDVVPTPETLGELITQMPAMERAALVIAYLEDHRPVNAAMVRITAGDTEGTKDRLERVIQYLDPLTRDALANIVEAVNRSPAEGVKAIRALGAWYGALLPAENIVKMPVKYGDPAATKADKVAEEGEAR